MSSADTRASDGPIDIVDLTTLVVTASRLAGGLANLPLFKSAGVSLPEWLALSVLASKDGVSNKILARSLGVTGQRANQLCTSLSVARLITITHAEDDSRRNVIRITEAGKKQLGSVNSQLQDLFTRALKGKKRRLTMASKNMRLMMRVVQGGAPKLMAKRKKKEKKRVEQDGAGHVSDKH